MGKKKRPGPESKAPIRKAAPASSPLNELFEARYYILYYAIFTAILTIVLFHKFVFSNEMLFGSDMLQAGVFFRSFFVNYLKSTGSIPLWDPYIFGGMPFVDAFHGDIFYPVSLVFKLILPFFRALGWLIVFHVFLASITMYLCARTFGVGKAAASVAGIFYMFAPYFVSMTAPGHDGKIFVTALFPLAIMFLERGMSRRKFIEFVGVGTIIGLIILTPHPQMAYFSLWGIGGYFLFRLIDRFVRERSLKNSSLLTAFFAISLAVGLCLSAIQFYPGYRYVKEFSPRAGEGRGGYEWATSWSMHPEELVGMVVPQFQGVDSNTESTYWGRNPFKDNSEYAGLFTILFAILGIVVAKDRRKWYFVGLALVALIYALGATTPLFYIFFYLVPNVKSMRAPSMIMFLFSFSCALLSAFAVNAIFTSSGKDAKHGPVEKVLLIAAGLYSLLAVFWSIAGAPMMRLYQSMFYSDIAKNKLTASLANVGNIQFGLWIVAILVWLVYLAHRMYRQRKFPQAAMIGVIVLVALVDTWRVDFKFIETLNPATRFSANPVVTNMQQDIGHQRVMDMTGMAFGSLDYFAYFGLQQVTGYHGNQLRVYDHLIGGLQKSNLYDRRGVPKRPLLNLLGVRYLVYSSQYPMPDTTLLKTYNQYGLAVYRNPTAYPRAYLTHEYAVIEQPDSIISLVTNPAFNSHKYVLLEKPPSAPPEVPQYGLLSEDCEIIEYDPGYVKIAYIAAAPAVLCLTDAYYPAWKVYVDGKQVPLERAYTALMAASVPKGEHTVEFVYDEEVYNISKDVTYGSILFILLSGLACVVYPRLKGRKSIG